ncbi:MAG: hypothetical protein HQL32_00125 [Planctomycetes bacterium]|nr:hypothetical protein [Planctomycetota bacterium]
MKISFVDQLLGELRLLNQELPQPLEERELLQLINCEKNATYVSLVTYLTSEEVVDDKQATIIWECLLKYREKMIVQYGNRATLVICFFHLARDPETLKKAGLSKYLKCADSIEAQAIESLKNWWERNEATGLHRSDVLEQCLDSECYLSKNTSSDLSLMKIIILSQAPLEENDFLSVSKLLSTSFRSRDTVAHAEEQSYWVILPGAPHEGGLIAAKRVYNRFQEAFSSNDFQIRISLATTEEGMFDPYLLQELVTEGLSKGAPQNNDIFDATALATPKKLWLMRKKKNLKSLLKPRIALMLILLLTLAYFSFKRFNYRYQRHWSLESAQNVDEQGAIPGWFWGYREKEGDDKQNRFAFHEHDGLIARGKAIILKANNQRYYQCPLDVVGEISMDFFLSLTVDAHLDCTFGAESSQNMRMEITSDKITFWLGNLCLGTLTHENDSRSKVRIDFESELIRMKTNADEQTLPLPAGLLPDSWPESLYLSCRGGSALMDSISIYSRPKVNSQKPSTANLWAQCKKEILSGQYEKTPSLISHLKQNEHSILKQSAEELLLKTIHDQNTDSLTKQQVINLNDDFLSFQKTWGPISINTWLRVFQHLGSETRSQLWKSHSRGITSKAKKSMQLILEQSASTPAFTKSPEALLSSLSDTQQKKNFIKSALCHKWQDMPSLWANQLLKVALQKNLLTQKDLIQSLIIYFSTKQNASELNSGDTDLLFTLLTGCTHSPQTILAILSRFLTPEEATTMYNKLASNNNNVEEQITLCLVMDKLGIKNVTAKSEFHVSSFNHIGQTFHDYMKYHLWYLNIDIYERLGQNDLAQNLRQKLARQCLDLNLAHWAKAHK